MSESLCERLFGPAHTQFGFSEYEVTPIWDSQIVNTFDVPDEMV